MSSESIAQGLLPAAHRRLLESLARGDEVGATLAALLSELASTIPGACALALELGPDDRLHPLAAPDVPADYLASLGEPRLSDAGPYGAAALLREPVVAEDLALAAVAARPAPMAALAVAHDLAGCAAAPILAGERRPLGVIALHRALPGAFEPAHLARLADAALLAALVLQHDRRGHEGRAAVEPDEVEQALRSGEDAFRALFEASPIASVILRPGSRQLFMTNAQARLLLGLDDRGVEALDVQALLERPEQFVELQRTIAARGEILEAEVRLRLQGELRDCLLSARRIPFHGSQVTFVSVSDVTARRRQEASLREAQRLESLGVLSGGIAHDFNNLLTPMFTNLDLAREYVDEGHPAHELIDDVKQSARRAAELVRQMLTYAGKGRVVVEPLDVGVVVRDLSELLAAATTAATSSASSSSATFQRARLVVDVPDGLPKVDADAAQLRQVILTLVTNASEALEAAPGHARDGGGAIRLSARLTKLRADELDRLRPGHDLAPGEYLTLEVADGGYGMSAETLERAFEPFFTTKGAGRGLGLSAVLGILRSHRGAIEVVSEEGRGTTIRVHLRTAAGRASRRVASSVGPKLRGRVLLADDDPAVRASASRLLGHLGLEVVAAEDGVEAVALFEARPGDFDVVLLDVTMPRMGGLEALALIRARSAAIPCVLCSGYSDRDVAVPEGQGLAFLAKPYTMQDAYRCLAQALGAAAR